MKAIVKTTLCPLYGQPDRRSPLLDEALYGMVLTVLDSPAPGWYHVRTHYRYEGCAPADCLELDEEKTAAWEELSKQVVLMKNVCDVMASPKVQSYPLVTLTRGALVSPVGDPEAGWQKVLLCGGQTGYTRSSFLSEFFDAPSHDDEKSLRSALLETLRLYNGTSYRWGGKTPLGIDCSGLVSMAYLLNGIVIYRDAQIREGFPIRPISRSEMKRGDLLFFPGHVAMYAGNGVYYHATGAAGSDGFSVNSLDPNADGYREDLDKSLTAVGTYF